ALQGDPREAPAQVAWKYRRSGDAAAPWQLEAHNPTPFHVSLARLELPAAAGVQRLDGLTVPPYATSRFALPAGHQPQAHASTLRYEAADDAGDLIH
ncbi:molecular chaperone, partial [Salmonella enterica subsp. enterica serovar 1,4,[5],12:i:-]|nr:molecular chaperone [Salmonella enterica subsp. enterica serovar 1,4,[5],12:i:-]